MCKYTNMIHVTDLSNVKDTKYLYRHDDATIRNYKYAIKSDANNNSKITNINHMTKLKELCAYGLWNK